MTAAELDGGPVPGLELEVPPKAAYVRTIRHSVGALARIEGVPDDLVEDIKLAVSEACTTAVGEDPTGDHDAAALRISVRTEGDRVIVDVVDPVGEVGRQVSGDPSGIDTEDLPFERQLAVPVIRGLVDDLDITPEETGGIRIRMAVSLSDREE